MIELAFWVLTLVIIGAAVAVVLLRDIFRAALLLILCFFAVAGIYITLNADFLAAVQVLIYAGAIGILLIFAIMLTRNLKEGSPFSKLNIPALFIALLVLATIVGVVVSTDWTTVTEVPNAVTMPIDESTTGYIAKALFDSNEGFVLPFEIASVLLLAALIGAIVLVRDRS
ncbi:MAG TPA: NADH-quinone oxidoreductase subunit J [Dehalococcoidia bacterium]|nr:NADH-quinone oxidoreductase subunit J [Dehalococcoidia bacterium]